MSAGRDVMPFSKRTYEKGLLSAKSGHQSQDSISMSQSSTTGSEAGPSLLDG